MPAPTVLYGRVYVLLLILRALKKGTVGSPKSIELEIRLYKNVKKIEFKYVAHKEILTDPEALYVAFPFSLPGSRIVFETIGGTLTQGQQLPGSSSDWNAAQNFVAVRGNKGQIVVVSNEVPLWHFSDSLTWVSLNFIQNRERHGSIRG